MTETIFGKRFCTKCGRNSMYYYKWKTSKGEKVMGECFSKGCNNIDYCDGETETSIKNRYHNRSWKDMNEPIDLL